MELIFLGTGNAFSESGDRPSCYAIQNKQNEIILLDCGPSILPALYKNNLKPNFINTVYISHLHPDHYMGLAFLFLDNFYVSKRIQPIEIICPFGLKEKLFEILKLMYEEEEVKTFDKCFTFTEIGNMDRYTNDFAHFQTIPALHGANGRMLIVTIEGIAKIGYSGDTQFEPETFRNLLNKSDIIIHETTSAEFQIIGHTNLFDLVDLSIPSEKHIFISHHDQSVIEALEHVQLPSNFHLARDDMKIDLEKLQKKSKIDLDI